MPLRIKIKSFSTEIWNEIIVEDNGGGFKNFNEKKPHSALKNIQQRLEIMCGGKLEILSREGVGTVVKIFVPKK